MTITELTLHVTAEVESVVVQLLLSSHLLSYGGMEALPCKPCHNHEERTPILMKMMTANYLCTGRSTLLNELV